eukprot:1974604-Ditylum_brightwellii.AAC.1
MELKEPEEYYKVTNLNDCIDDDLEDDNELTVALQKEREKAAHCIININQLWHAFKETVCKCCTEQRENDMIGNVADEFVTYIKYNINFNIPNNAIHNFKQYCKNVTSHNHHFMGRKNMLELQQN